MSPSRYGLHFHHFGLAAREEAPARTFLEGLGYEVGELITDPLQNVRVSLARAPGLPTVELVLAAGEEGPLSNVLKRQETNIYHSCYTTQDAVAALAAIEASGLQHLEVSAPKPAVLFGGRPVSFHYVSGFGLIELIHLRDAQDAVK
jgi:glyoxalase/bleomycin resistance protein/dioxygenase superfamily protein